MPRYPYPSKKFKKTGRNASRKRRTQSSVKRGAMEAFKPKEYFTSRSKIFPVLPNNFGAKLSFTSDPVWDIQVDPFQGTNNTLPRTAYLFINLLDMNQVTNSGGVNINRAYWHNTQHQAMLQVYEEFLYQTSYLTMDMYMDSVIVEQSRPWTRQIQVAMKIVPLSQLKKPTTVGTSNFVPCSNLDTGIVFVGLDYYGMLTGQVGTKQTVLTDDGNRGGQKISFKVDAFEHNGNPIKGKSRIRNTFDTDSGLIPATRGPLYAIPDYSSISTTDDQNVCLIAFRYFGGDNSNPFRIRANLKLDQHWIYSDLRNAAQDLTYDPVVVGQVPDGR